ncbi:hypothetical protein Curi_c28320 [Gottschalkia acidurici 9a]|uniref:Regulatory protein YycH domain-containing protein n=1 Tax=Gottschalkia acidurici (strain ATCC 7906 / DSM 604 / BCRC 14475 / CIP 104303 / KCTC 5404 / NCIMB 10678 / 9a) TaxID=1128398 RepID=K0B2X5_GOTA9|nr:hypothetical protein [Gottschalkia acidurici]AFS79824.1 hypothetical protein Curi_c28320 [Gottschalkia acidurici 9a]
MNREILKTLLLAFLVIMSIYFSKGLWDRTVHNSSESHREKINVNDPNKKKYELSDVIVPQKILVNFSENNRTVIYSKDEYDLWDEGKKSLDSVFNDKNLRTSRLSKEKYNELSSNKSINFQFSEALYTNMIGKILGIEIPKDIYKNIETINSIYFSLSEESFIVISNDKDRLMIKSSTIDLKRLKSIIYELENSEYTNFYKLEEVLGIKSDVYIPVNTKNIIPSIHISKRYNIDGETKIDDNMAELFFDKGIEYIKKIEENNGSSIYIDGDNILKIYPDGRLEYMGPIENNNENNLYSSLKKAVDFITDHMGWPENVYLSSINNKNLDGEDSKGYVFTFRYKLNGFTVMSNREDIQDKIEVEVVNGSVISYKSRIWNNMDIYNNRYRDSSDPILSAFEIIDDNFLFLKEKYLQNINSNTKDINSEDINDKVKNSITDVYLAYYGDLAGGQEILQPVWVIEILGDKYVFDAYSGEVKS